MLINEAIMFGLNNIQSGKIDEHAAKQFLDVLNDCGFTISCITNHESPLRHVDKSIPCPTCGFHVITKKAKPFVLDD